MEQLKEEIIFVFEPGDIVLFQDFQDRFKNNIGMILRHRENGNYVILCNYNSVYRDIHVRYSPYKSDNTGRPKKICIKFDDGDNEWYSRM